MEQRHHEFRRFDPIGIDLVRLLKQRSFLDTDQDILYSINELSSHHSQYYDLEGTLTVE